MTQIIINIFKERLFFFKKSRTFSLKLFLWSRTLERDFLFITNTPKRTGWKWAIIIQNCYLWRWLFTEPISGRMTQSSLWPLLRLPFRVYHRHIRKINLITVPLVFCLQQYSSVLLTHLIYLALNKFRLLLKPIHLERIKIYPLAKTVLKLLQDHLDGWIYSQGD